MLNSNRILTVLFRKKGNKPLRIVKLPVVIEFKDEKYLTTVSKAATTLVLERNRRTANIRSNTEL